MFNVGASELLVILLVALIVLGPDKLPETARKMGNVVAELRRMASGFR
jgi:sec-independent protein translocase protein TatB